jgi:DNA-binding NarL/FixJ family response regulator
MVADYQSINIKLVEDQPVASRGLMSFVNEAGFSLLSKNIATTKEEIIELINQDHTDLLFIDLHIPLANGDSPDFETGFALLKQLKKDYSNINCMVISHTLEAHYIFRILSMGISAALKGDILRPKPIKRAIQTVMDGNLFYSGSLAPLVSEASRAARRIFIADEDIEIIKLILNGYTNSQIGVEIGFGESNVKKRLSSLFKWTGIDDRTSLAYWYKNYHSWE